MHALHKDLPPMPERIRRLPVAPNGYPIPWFVAEVAQPDGSTTRDFRVADAEKRVDAIRLERCHICGGPLGAHKAFVLGPMCAINLTSSEPPMHRDCAEWSLQACPFLTRPHMRRRDENYPEGWRDAPGLSINRNPGVSLLWVTRKYQPFAVPGGGFLLRVGDPLEVRAYREGREATEAEILGSIGSGFHILFEAARAESPRAVQELAAYVRRAATQLGISEEAMMAATFEQAGV